MDNTLDKSLVTTDHLTSQMIESARRFAEKAQALADCLKQAVEVFSRLAEFRVPAWLQLANELEDWGMPRRLALWIVWRLPYSWAQRFIDVIRY